VATGCSRYVNAVATPKLPPPPRSAQNRSGCEWASTSPRVAAVAYLAVAARGVLVVGVEGRLGLGGPFGR
jgi:hypothetical protein